MTGCGRGSSGAGSGDEVTFGGIRCAIVKDTVRCDATNVDPKTGARDMAIPSELQRTWGHSDLGVYGKIVTGGALAVGDAVAVPGA